MNITDVATSSGQGRDGAQRLLRPDFAEVRHVRSKLDAIRRDFAQASPQAMHRHYRAVSTTPALRLPTSSAYTRPARAAARVCGSGQLKEHAVAR